MVNGQIPYLQAFLALRACHSLIQACGAAQILLAWCTLPKPLPDNHADLTDNVPSALTPPPHPQSSPCSPLPPSSPPLPTSPTTPLLPSSPPHLTPSLFSCSPSASPLPFCLPPYHTRSYSSLSLTSCGPSHLPPSRNTSYMLSSLSLHQLPLTWCSLQTLLSLCEVTGTKGIMHIHVPCFLSSFSHIFQYLTHFAADPYNCIKNIKFII